MTDHRRIELPEAVDLDMTGGHEPIPLAIRLAVAQLFGRIPGVRFEHLALVSRERAGSTLAVEYVGWSPTLHELRHDVRIRVPGVRVASKDDGAAVIAALEPAMDAQTTRQRLGARHNLSAPLLIDRDNYENIETRHLTIDRSLIAFARDADVDLAEEIPSGLAMLHVRPATEVADYLGDGTGYAVLCGLGHFVGMRTTLVSASVAKASYDGMALVIHDTVMPETTLALATGRPLRDLARVHPALDDRIVLSASVDDAERNVKVTFHADVIPFSRLADTGR